jgi:predicted naringenin-chalcone synthase
MNVLKSIDHDRTVLHGPVGRVSRMTIAGVASALPAHRYSQENITAALKHHWNGSLERPELQERLHARAGVEYRHLAFPLEQYARFGSWGETNAAWLEVAQELGVRAIDGALERAGLKRQDLDAVVVAGAEKAAGTPRQGPQILGCRSVFYPDSEDIMGWDISQDGFRIVLSPQLPELIKRHLAGDLDTFLESFGLNRADIGNWLIHTGGPKVLEAIQYALGLCDGELERSWECLRRCGNLSSASVLLVLEDVTMQHRPAPRTLGVLLAMGPGFCSEMILVRW